SFDDVVVSYFLVAYRTNFFIFDRRLAFFMELAQPNVFIFCRCMHFHRDVDESETDRSFPHRMHGEILLRLSLACEFFGCFIQCLFSLAISHFKTMRRCAVWM